MACHFNLTHAPLPVQTFKRSSFKFQCNFDDEPRGPTAISPLQVGLPTRRELAPGHAPLIFDREVLRALAHKLCRYEYTMIVSEWLSQLAIVLPAR